MDSEDTGFEQLGLTACGHSNTESAREGCPICNRATQVLGRLDDDAVITGQVPVGGFSEWMLAEDGVSRNPETCTRCGYVLGPEHDRMKCGD